MKSISIIAIAVFALVASCSSLPLASEQPANDLVARLDALNFFYDNILHGLFSGIVSGSINHLSNTLTGLIDKIPTIGKREANDLTARVDVLNFIYDNILQNLFSGLVTNSANFLQNTLVNLIQTNPLGIGKREATDDLTARIEILDFLYDNILQNFFSGLVTNSANLLQNTLVNLIQTNPLGIGKREAIDDLAARGIFDFLYDNILQNFFTGLVTNSANLLQDTLVNLIETNPLGIGKRSVDIQQIQTIITQTASTLIQKFKTFTKQAAASWNDRQKLNQLVQGTIADIKATIHQSAQQLSQLIPSAITNEVAQVLAAFQATLIYWTSGLGGSLGPVIGPFLP